MKTGSETSVTGHLLSKLEKADNSVAEAVFCFTVAIVYQLLFNWRLEKIEHYLFSFALISLTIHAIMAHRRLFALALPIVYVPSALASYFQRRYNVPMDSDIVASFFETEPAEASEFITAKLILWVALSVGLAALFIAGFSYLAKRRREKRDLFVSVFLLLIVFSSYYFAVFPLNRIATGIVVGVFLVAGLVGTSFRRFVSAPRKVKALSGSALLIISAVAMLSLVNAAELRNFYPYSYVVATGEYYQNYQGMLQAMREKVDIADFPSEFDEKKGEGATVVVIIGESVRADHFQINGYRRETTPLLAKREGIVNFPNMLARSADTRIALPNLLTRLTGTKVSKLAKETSFINLFKKHGFYTAWITMNPVFGRSNFSTTALARASDYVFYRREFISTLDESRDDCLLPIYRKVLDEHRGKLLVVLHTRGSHWRYDNRYPEAFAKFQPTEGMSNTAADCDPEALVNSYDNSILFTDYIIDTVMEEVAGRKSLVVFVGDHGESLGEDGAYLHSNRKRREQRNVPFLWWASPRFAKYYGKELAALRSRTAENVSHDHFFHTLLDLTGFKSKVIKRKLSLAR